MFRTEPYSLFRFTHLADNWAATGSVPARFGVVEPAPELMPEDVEKARKGYLLKRFWITARGFWGAAGNRLALPLSITLLLLIVTNVAFQYGINVWNRLIFDAIEKRDAATVFRLTGIFFPLAIGSVLLGVAQVFTRMSIQRRWRAWATHPVVSRWLKNGRYYQLNLVEGDHQNPETRIAEDLRIATDSPVDFVSGVTSALLSAVTFIVVLWTIGGALTLPAGDRVIAIPGFLVIAAVLYATIASGSITIIGRRFVGISEDKNQAEAEYRYVLTRVRENGESIALLGGEEEERTGIDRTFDNALRQWRRLAGQYMRTTLVSQGSSLIAPVVPILLCAPKFLDGSMSLGEVMQAASAFTIVQGAFGWLVDNYPRLADWNANARRIASLLMSLDGLERAELGDGLGRIKIGETGDNMMVRLTEPALPFRSQSPIGNHQSIKALAHHSGICFRTEPAPSLAENPMVGAKFGAALGCDGVTFRLWAPAAKRVEVILDVPHEMQRSGDGWFTATVAAATSGSRYGFRIDGETQVPDPASCYQPDGVLGPSEVIDHDSYRWRASEWRGRPWQEAVVLEAHVGTFTAEGTYRAMIERLDHLVATGITALELMPLADFPGRRNWGYDGVLWYAPANAYGRPDDLRTLVDEAHLRGLMVFLDVVYNHFGPEGNFLGRYAPAFFSTASTPWGNAIDYRVPQMRQFAIESALSWLDNYRFDGLRLDAVHAIVEPGDPPFLAELSRQVGRFAEATQRTIHLILENDDNRAALLDPSTDPLSGRYRAQWNDDYHHAWHVLLTGENAGYYQDYPDPHREIARALGSGFIYQGEASKYRGGKRRGEPSQELPPTAFVTFLQNHDQIGNRPFGDRLETIGEPAAMEAALAITLLAPMPPMLFMGEEWGSRAPFPFFCDFAGDLAEAVRQGRRREFQAAYAAHGDEIPDPLDDATFRSACLDWHELVTRAAQKRLSLVRQLLAVRKARIVSRLTTARFGDADITAAGLLSARWKLGESRSLTLRANLSETATPSPASEPRGEVIWGDGNTEVMAPWSVVWTTGGS